VTSEFDPRPNAYDGAVSLRGLVKRFADRSIVDHVSIDVRAGEFFALLGPSGCGKTTTLRMIAGFETPDEGKVVIDDVDVTSFPPEKRLCNTVFQNYSLFPHLNVQDNVKFGLRFSPFERDERAAVGKALEMVRLTGFERRRVQQLSGGEQQRVALARAIVLEPSVLLLDEPLGALDAQLRHDLQVELSGLQRALDTTFIYVTHDQEEAFTMSDRIGVMRDGRLLQVGTPEELYEEPVSVAVATFVGTANIVPATVHNGTLETLGMRMPTTVSNASAVRVLVRPERVHVAADASRIIDGAASTPATVERVVFAGSSLQVSLRVAGETLVAEVPNDDLVPDLRHGQEVTVCVRAPDVRVLTE